MGIPLCMIELSPPWFVAEMGEEATVYSREALNLEETLVYVSSTWPRDSGVGRFIQNSSD
jgi:hypothetical protein